MHTQTNTLTHADTHMIDIVLLCGQPAVLADADEAGAAAVPAAASVAGNGGAAAAVPAKSWQVLAGESLSPDITKRKLRTKLKQ